MLVLAELARRDEVLGEVAAPQKAEHGVAALAGHLRVGTVKSELPRRVFFFCQLVVGGFVELLVVRRRPPCADLLRCARRAALLRKHGLQEELLDDLGDGLEVEGLCIRVRCLI